MHTLLQVGIVLALCFVVFVVVVGLFRLVTFPVPRDPIASRPLHLVPARSRPHALSPAHPPLWGPLGRRKDADHVPLSPVTLFSACGWHAAAQQQDLARELGRVLYQTL